MAREKGLIQAFFVNLSLKFIGGKCEFFALREHVKTGSNACEWSI
jgi:hypothetical protein